VSHNQLTVYIACVILLEYLNLFFLLNIFVTSPSPQESAIVLPDRHITKMALEACQMLSIVASAWYHSYGVLPKADGSPYNTEKGAFRNHPCTKWAAASSDNARWLIEHGLHICDEFNLRYGKPHSCYKTLIEASKVFPKGDSTNVTDFVRAMPDEFKLDTSIDTFTAYKMYIGTKPWVKNNYLKIPSRKPDWI
jgi:hypothetical protein